MEYLVLWAKPGGTQEAGDAEWASARASINQLQVGQWTTLGLTQASQ